VVETSSVQGEFKSSRRATDRYLPLLMSVMAVPVPHRPAMPTGRQIATSMLLLGALCLNGPRAEAFETATCPERSIRIPVGASIQAAVDAAAARTTFCIEAGLHRAQRVAPKDGQVFVGMPGAVMSGAERLSDFRQEGGLWVAAVTDRPMRPFGTCLKSRPACNGPMRFFLDDRPLEPVSRLADLRTGAVFHDSAAGKAYLTDDPRGRNLERTTRDYAFWSNGARNVVVRGLIVEKYATPAQQGAIFGNEDPRASGWLIENNEVRFNSGAGIATGDRTIVRANRVHHNGQLGISPNGFDVVIEDNEIYENNIHGYDATWEGGGVKAGKIERLTMRRNRVHGNYGSGLWCVDCRDILIEDNIVESNADAGIFYEISFDAVIRNNIVRLNGTGAGGQQGSVWFWGAGIQIAASQSVQVYGNIVTVAPDGAGIMLIDQARPRDSNPPRFYRTSDNLVRDNIVIYEGRAGMSGGASDVAASSPNFGIIETGGNRFDGNTYIVQPSATPAAFIWGHQPVSYETFRSLGQESRGNLVRRKLDAVPTPARAKAN
jgi:parallel beta-helix repeat protein